MVIRQVVSEPFKAAIPCRRGTSVQKPSREGKKLGAFTG